MVQLYVMPSFFLAVLILGLALNLLSRWVFFHRLRRWTRSRLLLFNLTLALPSLINRHLDYLCWRSGADALCGCEDLLPHLLLSQHLLCLPRQCGTGAWPSCTPCALWCCWTGRRPACCVQRSRQVASVLSKRTRMTVRTRQRTSAVTPVCRGAAPRS